MTPPRDLAREAREWEERARAACADVTEGEWRAEYPLFYPGDEGPDCAVLWGVAGDEVVAYCPEGEADAVAIAASRSLVPEAIALLHDLGEDVERLRDTQGSVDTRLLVTLQADLATANERGDAWRQMVNADLDRLTELTLERDACVAQRDAAVEVLRAESAYHLARAEWHRFGPMNQWRAGAVDAHLVAAQRLDLAVVRVMKATSG